MIKFLYKLLLIINFLILLPIYYLIKNQIYINIIGWWSILLYLSIPIVLTYFLIKISYFCSNDCIKGGIKKIRLENNEKLLFYQIYYIILASIIPKEYPMLLIYTFISLFIILFIFYEQLLKFYSNPLFLLFGYQIYYITNQKNMEVCVISKQKIRNVKVLSLLLI